MSRRERGRVCACIQGRSFGRKARETIWDGVFDSITSLHARLTSPLKYSVLAVDRQIETVTYHEGVCSLSWIGMENIKECIYLYYCFLFLRLPFLASLIFAD